MNSKIDKKKWMKREKDSGNSDESKKNNMANGEWLLSVQKHSITWYKRKE